MYNISIIQKKAWFMFATTRLGILIAGYIKHPVANVVSNNYYAFILCGDPVKPKKLRLKSNAALFWSTVWSEELSYY